jgi:HD domain
MNTPARPADPAPDPAWFHRASGYDASGSIHGLGHTRRVMIHARAIAQAEGFLAWEQEALIQAALWHDIGRTDDSADYYHGAKSAGKVLALGLHQGLEPLVYETALFAVTHHSGSDPHGERASRRLEFFQPRGESFRKVLIPEDSALRVFRALKDADALDRVRLGDLDESYLRFPSSRERVEIASALLDEIP